MDSTAKSIQAVRLKKIAASTLVAIALAFLYRNKLFTYSVRGDDYSLIESSRSFDIHNWLFSGFSDYFYVFDGSAPYTNFVRPVVNLVFWANNQVFPENLGLYFLSGILFVAMYCYQLLSLFKFRLFSALLILLFCISSPSIAQASLSSPPFAFDVLAATFVLAAINASFQNRFYPTVCFLVFAVFTKEIGLVACIAFAVWELIKEKYAGNRSNTLQMPVRLAGYLSPIVAYAVVRYFGVGLGGTYSTNNLGFSTLVFRVLKFPFRFPLGIDGPLRGYPELIISGQLSDIIVRVLPLLINLCVFMGTAWLFVKYIKLIQRTSAESTPIARDLNSNNILLLSVFAITSIYLLVMGTDSRLYPLPQGCLLVMLARGIDLEIVSKRMFRILMIFLFAIYSFLFVIHVRSVFAYQSGTLDDKVLSGVIKEARHRQMRRVLLVNAPDLYSSPKYISKYYGFNGDLDFLYNSKGSCGSFPEFILKRQGEKADFAYQIKPDLGSPNLVASDKCELEISFNGYLLKQNNINKDSSEIIYQVDGNSFHHLGITKGKKKEKLDLQNLQSIKVKKEYDGIFVANYETGGVRVLLPVLHD